MKKLLATMFVALLMVGCGEEPGGDSPESNASSAEIPPAQTAEVAKVVVDLSQLEQLLPDLWHFEGKPFTGVAVSKHDNGQKKEEGTFKNGKEHGPWTIWHKNGQRDLRTHKDGKMHGLHTSWHPNGQKYMEYTYKDGKKHGLSTRWYENGQKKYEFTYRDGKYISATSWKPNGEQCPDTNLVNGNGIVCFYHENGQKRTEMTYKDGKPISFKEWDKDGNQTK